MSLTITLQIPCLCFDVMSHTSLSVEYIVPVLSRTPHSSVLTTLRTSLGMLEITRDELEQFAEKQKKMYSLKTDMRYLL